jgi:hypothetical protein
MESAEDPLSEIISDELRMDESAPSLEKDGARIRREVDAGASEETFEAAWSILQSQSYDVRLADLEALAEDFEERGDDGGRASRR